MVKVLGIWFKSARQPLDLLGVEFKTWMIRADEACLYRAIFCGLTDKTIMLSLIKLSRGESVSDVCSLVPTRKADNIEIFYKETVEGIANGRIEPFGENLNLLELKNEICKLHQKRTDVAIKNNPSKIAHCDIKTSDKVSKVKNQTKENVKSTIVVTPKTEVINQATEILPIAKTLNVSEDKTYIVFGVKCTAQTILHALGFKDDFIKACNNEFTALGLKQVVKTELCHKVKLSDDELSLQLSNLVTAYTKREKFENEWLEREAFRAELLGFKSDNLFI